MTIQEKQNKILSLLEHLNNLTKHQLPVDERDPRLKDVGHLLRGGLFSLFHMEHLTEATHLYETLYNAEDFDDFIHLCEQAKDVVNEGMFAYAISVAVLHRNDCKGLALPPIQEIFPDRFIPAETITEAIKDDHNRHDHEVLTVEARDTGNILNPEQHLAYFREDIETNAHHWHWHIVYPATRNSKVMHKVKDRKGELFFYMHQQMCARYDCERLSVGLQRMLPFQNFEEELEGYSAHLTSLVSGLHYASRPEGMHLHDLKGVVNLYEMERWRERIMDAIERGLVFDDDNHEHKLEEPHGIDMLGAIIEASHDSVKHDFYGSIHNWGHVMFARLHDPDGRYHDNPGVMSDTATSLRDPIFYRFHRYIDNMFQTYKATLHSHEHHQLTFSGVQIDNVTVKAKQPNVINTYTTESELELSHGIHMKGPTKVKYHHLDHDKFDYSISVNNTSGLAKNATFRIFLGPKYDELGNLLTPEQQRRFFIELDKFHREVPTGKSVITRSSADSSVTISHVPTFEELRNGKGVDVNNSEFCSCGWPQHMLIPRGNYLGMEFQLFVMLTDWEQDKAGKDLEHLTCADAVSYCGARDHLYPDKKPMGYPFDRPIKAHTVEEFLTPNMSLTDVKIQYKGNI
uniref:Hemocyanin subunit IIIb n=1 Tax=Carcinoscorpius rotundicauda TaxID=6848 RepID=A1X1V4_CARRO|nr:hemocyanin subunit IIIb [Carcinoscorpius rotundicauda]